MVFPQTNGDILSRSGAVLGNMQNGVPVFDQAALSAFTTSQTSFPISTGSPPVVLPPFQEGYEPTFSGPTIFVTPIADPQPLILPGRTIDAIPLIDIESLPITVDGLPTIMESRACQESEQYVRGLLPVGTLIQQSFKGRKLVPYGIPGSVRSDLTSADLKTASWEVKNYNLATNTAGLINATAAQGRDRALNLPAGMTQYVYIDITGQDVTADRRDAIRLAIETKSSGAINKDNIEFFERK